MSPMAAEKNGSTTTTSTATTTTTSPPPPTCLHCSKVSTKIQVSCDACQGMICTDCHWCHEYQANHEIRVCDRCDSFLCRSCEEMDQCHDCGEVVCRGGGCGSLLSCKFCGSALCEECATACAKCGIVLCGRDAKFAVDCDTCKLSYCLVCLASGQKAETCIRCHHRPSKRMEQLVHLRLKSIYKAFQQSARNNTNNNNTIHSNSALMGGSGVGSNDSHGSNNGGGGDPMLKKAALAAFQQQSSHNQGSSTLHSAPLPSHNNANHHHPHDLPKVDPAVARAQADAAAAELLAELDQQEQQQQNGNHQKTSKKKKKKRKKKANNNSGAHQEQPSLDQDQQQEEKEETGAPPKQDIANDDDKAEKHDKSKKEPDKAPEESKHKISVTEDQESGSTQPTNDETKSSTESSNKDTKDSHQIRDDVIDTADGKKKENENLPSRALAVDPVQQQRLCELVNKGDLEGIEALLEEWKGVPGKSLLRKNAKKALKRLKCKYKIIRETPKAGGEKEIVLEVHRSWVSAIIGVGGRSIRELMDESGARVWIDQDSMPDHEPRIVYMSGEGTAVEMAIQRVISAVETAAAAAEGGNKKEEDEPPQANPEKEITKDPPAPKSDARETPPKKEPNHRKGWVKRELTCESRFVPLLIGRRGWTIKHIQDASGAKVDINQSVIPRVITITGPPEAVQTAIRLVSDVLSYPQAQLKQDDREDDEDEEEQEDELRAHSPPPSSLIMTGDIKSIVSASSSLSSTPEPSMASSRGGGGPICDGVGVVAGARVQPPPGMFGPAEHQHLVSDGGVTGVRPGSSNGILGPAFPQPLPPPPMAEHQQATFMPQQTGNSFVQVPESRLPPHMMCHLISDRHQPPPPSRRHSTHSMGPRRVHHSQQQFAVQHQHYRVGGVSQEPQSQHLQVHPPAGFFPRDLAKASGSMFHPSTDSRASLGRNGNINTSDHLIDQRSIFGNTAQQSNNTFSSAPIPPSRQQSSLPFKNANKTLDFGFKSVQEQQKQDESNLIDFLFGKDNNEILSATGLEGLIIDDFATGCNTWAKQPTESRFQWGSSS